jgi:hypothetical protein
VSSAFVPRKLVVWRDPATFTDAVTCAQLLALQAKHGRDIRTICAEGDNTASGANDAAEQSTTWVISSAAGDGEGFVQVCLTNGVTGRRALPPPPPLLLLLLLLLRPFPARCQTRPDSLKSSSPRQNLLSSPLSSNSIDLKWIISAESNIDGSCFRKSLKSKIGRFLDFLLDTLLPYGKTGGAAVAF